MICIPSARFWEMTPLKSASAFFISAETTCAVDPGHNSAQHTAILSASSRSFADTKMIPNVGSDRLLIPLSQGRAFASPSRITSTAMSFLKIRTHHVVVSGECPAGHEGNLRKYFFNDSSCSVLLLVIESVVVESVACEKECNTLKN